MREDDDTCNRAGNKMGIKPGS
jgi:hypothetical protein